jgi:hypothetical protein
MQKILYTMSTMAAISVVGVILALASCTQQVIQTTTEQRITGKWTMKTAIGNYTVQGVNRKDTTRFTTADYFDFKANGTLTIVETQKTYSGNWKVVNNKLVITNTNYMDYATNGFDIPILTSTDFQLYYTEATSAATLEQKLNLSK